MEWIGTDSVTSAFSKSSVFIPSHVEGFQKVPLWRAFLKKVPFSVIVFVGYVWTEAVFVKKKLRFQMKTDTLKAQLHCVIFRATCLATPLRDKLHESLPNVTYLATVKYVARPVAETVVESRIEFWKHGK